MPAEGVLLGLPARAGTLRRFWMTRGLLARASGPRFGAFSFYAPDFFLDDAQPWIVSGGEDTADWVGEYEPAALERLGRLSGGIELPAEGLAWMPPSRLFFEECFADLQREFEAGQLAKAVPVFFERALFAPSPAQVAQWIAALAGAPRALTPYGRWSERGGMLGGTPELLFEISNGVLTTMALAGTLAAPLDSDTGTIEGAEQAFLADPKEHREHGLVIEGIARDLAPLGAVTVGATRVLKLPMLWHLETPITVALRAAPDFEQVARLLHPTPALGGTPRAASVAWLRAQDTRQGPGQGRGGFGAPFGVQCPDGSAFCLVAVRNMSWDTEQVRIGAGSGIIRESRSEREWAELRRKRESVKGLLGL